MDVRLRSCGIRVRPRAGPRATCPLPLPPTPSPTPGPVQMSGNLAGDIVILLPASLRGSAQCPLTPSCTRSTPGSGRRERWPECRLRRRRWSKRAFAILASVDLNDRARRSRSRRFAEHVESLAQAVAERVIDLAVEVLDVNSLVARIDMNVLLGRIELNSLLHRVDLNEVLTHVDLNRVLETVDLNEVLDRVDMNKLLAQVDINQLASRVDIEALVRNTDLGTLLVSSSSNLATEAIDLGRSHAVRMDDTLARWVSKLRPNHTGRPGPPALLNAREEP